MISNTARIGWTVVLASILIGSLSVAQTTAQSVPRPNVPVLSLFGLADTPANVNWNDPRPVEVGVKFQSAVLGKVLGIRFYKGPSNTGPHVGSLWSAQGALLGQATFTNETADGWQEVDFPEPVLLSPGATYIASYHTNGFYAATNNYFSGARINGPSRLRQVGVTRAATEFIPTAQIGHFLALFSTRPITGSISLLS
jgi:Domain of unknown function (DUF4082)